MSQSLFVPGVDLRESIARLQREDLQNLMITRPAFDRHFQGQSFIRVKGISRFWVPAEGKQTQSLSQNIEDFVTGLYGQGLPLAYLVLGAARQITVFWGLPRSPKEDPGFLPRLLQGILPHVRLEKADPSHLAKETGPLTFCSQITGIPSAKVGMGEGEGSAIDRLVRGLYGERFAYLVLARPVDPPIISATFETLADEAGQVKNSYLRKDTSEADNNPLAQYYLDLLTAGLEKFKLARIQGCWEVETYLLTSSPGVLERGETLLSSIFSGDQSLPTPIRIHRCMPSKGKEVPHASTILNTKDLSLMTGMPKEEFPGYFVSPFVGFSVSLPEMPKEKPVAIGQVLDGDAGTGNWFEAAVSDLTKHALVAGVTGSGKTNTCMFLLDQIWREYKIPFLVIEPSMKTEYRDLRGVDWGRDLRVFTMGKETEAPFRINPFEVEEGVSVQTHIDHLRSLFTASFAGLYAPMPYLLEEAIQKVYLDKGWDLATGENIRGGGPRSFPTLAELAAKVEEVVESAGYDLETTQNIRSALRVRLSSLRTGGKGLMLDTRSPLDFAELLKSPTVLELGAVGDDEEKAFLIGLLLIRLCEYRISGRDPRIPAGLQHLTLIEEAHRLLRNIPLDSGNVEASHAKAKAVEAFCNLLAEIRAFGEGIIVCEQIPAKLAPDAIKNTGLKILHRTVAEDDRNRVGASMNMAPDQQRKIASLKTGQAAAYGEEMEGPFLIQVPQFKDHAIRGEMLKASTVRSHMEAVFYNGRSTSGLPFPACVRCTVQDRCERTRTAVRPLLVDEAEFKEYFDRLFLSILHGEGIAAGYSELVDLSQRRLHLAEVQAGIAHAYCAILHHTERSMEEKAKLYGLSFSEVETLIRNFMEVVADLGRGLTDGGQVKIGKEVATLIYRFQEQYGIISKRSKGPTIGCSSCVVPCRYQYEVKTLVNDEVLESDFDKAIAQSEPTELWTSLAGACLGAVGGVSGTSKPDVRRNLAFCFAVQMVAHEGYATFEQQRIAQNLFPALEDVSVSPGLNHTEKEESNVPKG